MLDQRDYDEVARLAHSIKGSASPFGLDEFTESAGKPQASANKRRDEGIEAALREILDLIENVDLDSDKTEGCCPR